MSSGSCPQRCVCWRQAGGLPLPDAPISRRAGSIIRELSPLLPELLPGLMFTGTQRLSGSNLRAAVCAVSVQRTRLAVVELLNPSVVCQRGKCARPRSQALREPHVAELTLPSRCAGEMFVRKLISRVAARIAQESLGQDEREFTVGGRAAAVRPAYLLGQQAAALGVGSPFAGILPDLLLPPTAAEMMSYPGGNIQPEGRW